MRRFTRDTKIFLIIQTLFTLSTALSATFVNVYMWKLISDFRIIGIYNIVVYAFVPVTFVLSGFIARKKDILLCTRLGIIGYTLFYIIILLLRERVQHFIIPLGAFYGCGMGFYYFGNNTLIYHYTEDSNRSYFLGISGALGGIMGTLAPMVSGWLIISQAQLKGYYTVFFISFLLFVISVILSYFLKKKRVEGKYEIGHIVFRLHNKAWDKIMISNFIFGLRDGAMGYILNILVFLAFRNELNMGRFTTITALLGIVSAYIVGRIYREKLERRLFFAGSVLCAASTVVLVLYTNYIGVIINGVMTAIFANFWSIPYSTMNYSVASKIIDENKQMCDFMVAREIPTALGRISSIIIYIIVSMSIMDTAAIKIILPLLSSVILINYVYLHGRKNRNIRKREI